MKMIFDNFQIQKWVSFGVSCLVFMSSSRVMVLKLSKIVCFLQFFADISKKFKIVIAIYVYETESSCFALLENGIGYYGWLRV